MKKKLEAELVSIAHRVLKLKGKEDVLKLHQEVSVLFEKLSVLKFAHENFEDDIPTIGNDSSFFGMLDVAFNNKVSDNIEIEDRIYVNLDDREHEAIMEPAIEKIKDMVAQMPHETQIVDTMFEKPASSPKVHKSDFEELTADFIEEPIFDPVNKEALDSKKSLNDKLKSGGLQIGLNDKLAFIKHLFNGEAADYDRVLSQLNTVSTFHEAKTLINTIVKPDYNNWLDKEEYEERFIELIEGKFN